MMHSSKGGVIFEKFLAISLLKRGLFSISYKRFMLKAYVGISRFKKVDGFYYLHSMAYLALTGSTKLGHA